MPRGLLLVQWLLMPWGLLLVQWLAESRSHLGIVAAFRYHPDLRRR
jgi:hypothetical protein